MEGEKLGRAETGRSARLQKGEKSTTEKEDPANAKPASMEASTEANSLADIHAAIQIGMTAIRQDMKKDLDSLRASIREDMKKELSDFKDEINQSLGAIRSELTATTTRLDNVEQRVADGEDRTLDVEEALQAMILLHDSTQAKLLDMQMRQRRNNMRIFAVDEDETEALNLKDWVTTFLINSVGISADLDLKIQRCHRALGPKPPKEAPPRSIIVNFLESTTQELVVSTAWKKGKILYKDKRLFIDNDYPPEIKKKRGEYSDIRKLLQKEGIKFRTPPPARLKVLFEDGTVIYDDAKEAADDLRGRGYSLPEEGGPTSEGGGPSSERGRSAPSGRRRQPPWTKVGGGKRKNTNRAEQIREKLRQFRHNPQKK